MDTGADPANAGSLPGPSSNSTEALEPESGRAFGDVRAAETGEIAALGARLARAEGSVSLGGHRRRSRRSERGPFYAALDLGTNNCRLLVAEP
jgi:exopolyphosphatase/guanosine-5'-triphosphate,3'-diphosphate pyrophosphatase